MIHVFNVTTIKNFHIFFPLGEKSIFTLENGIFILHTSRSFTVTKMLKDQELSEYASGDAFVSSGRKRFLRKRFFMVTDQRLKLQPNMFSSSSM